MLNSTNLKVNHTLDTAELEHEFQRGLGKPVAQGIARFFEAMIPYLEIAHNAGGEGTPLCDVFLFLREEQEA